MIHRNRFRDNLGWLSSFLLIFACTATSQEQESAKAPEEAEAPIPVIFDTDIGTDIDDTWALAQLLASPELDLRLVVTDSGDTETRARIVAK
ncbi:MAG: hypothetical protein AAGA81_18415, partial [Acidobacteriota bacterium]